MAAAAALDAGDFAWLTDGSSAGDWRLPTKEEWEAFVVTTYNIPALCNAAGTAQWTEGNAFIGVQSYFYWSSTEYAATIAWYVAMYSGVVDIGYKDVYYYVWPVRADN